MKLIQTNNLENDETLIKKMFKWQYCYSFCVPSVRHQYPEYNIRYQGMKYCQVYKLYSQQLIHKQIIN
ncbi:hypothetical protein pb186bvf_001670 [Paramecium bursaria]